MSKEKSAPDEDVWWSGMKWVEAARMQALRFERAVGEWNHALADARTRDLLNEGSKDVAYRASYDRDYAPFDPRRPLRVPTDALHIQLTVEANFLLVAVRNVIRAHDRLPQEVQTTIGDIAALKDLRDLTEHFDELGGRAATSLSANHPDVEPSAFAATGEEIWIGGLHGVPLSRVRAWLERVWMAFCASLRTSGVDVPHDLMCSRVLGDDDLEWPAERLRYHWSIPQLPEQEWPREETLEPIARPITERCRSPRRDVTD